MRIQVCFSGSPQPERDATLIRGRTYPADGGPAFTTANHPCAAWGTLAEWEAGLRSLTGCFAVVHRSGNEVFAAVDRARSIPLFYGVNGGTAYVADDAHWVAARLGVAEGDEPASTEFLLGGFVTGRDTLAPGVKQLTAGDVLRVHAGGAEVRRYYRYIHQPDPCTDADVLLEQLDAAVHGCFARLVDHAGGRCIAVPLSGGLDSRLILTQLRRMGYPSLMAYSYGRPGNREAVISQEVASRLGVPWHFVRYTNDDWRRWFLSDERRRYYRMADGLSAVPHIQDWPAVGELSRRGVLPERTVFVPGFSADLQAGSRSKYFPEFYRPGPHSRDRLVRALVHAMFDLWDWSGEKSSLYPVLAARVAQGFSDYDDFPNAASALESWDARERASKYVLNSVRVYEFWGHDWWLPYRDVEFLDFWAGVPLELRVGKRLYRAYVDQVFARQAGLPAGTRTGTAQFGQVLPYIRRRVRGTPLYPRLREAYRRLRVLSERDRHLMAWFGIVPPEVMRGARGWSCLCSFLAADRLGQLDLSADHAGTPVLAGS